MASLQGKSAIVLGAAKPGNMGQVIARRLAKEGVKVMVAGRHEQALADLAKDIGGAYAVCDITKKADLENLAKQTKDAFGKIDIAVNASGVARGGKFTDYAEEDLLNTMMVQFKGPFQFLQTMVKAMDKGGSIIQISSATATIMTYDFQAYMGTKAGIDHVVRAVANEYGAQGIRVNSISPGLTETPMTEAVFKMQPIVDAFVAGYPMGRLGTSEDVAAAVVWLADDECFMTGENLQVNGGLTLRSNPSPQQRQAAMEKAAAKS